MRPDERVKKVVFWAASSPSRDVPGHAFCS